MSAGGAVFGEAPRVMGESMRSFSLRSTGWVEKDPTRLERR